MNSRKNESEHKKTEFSKQQLANQYRISLRTVYRTLELVGLSTRKARYSAEEVYLFALAREFLNQGYTKAQVIDAIREFLTQKRVTPYEQERITGTPEQRPQDRD